MPPGPGGQAKPVPAGFLPVVLQSVSEDRTFHLWYRTSARSHQLKNRHLNHSAIEIAMRTTQFKSLNNLRINNTRDEATFGTPRVDKTLGKCRQEVLPNEKLQDDVVAADRWNFVAVLRYS
jgi:hypothetical protein